METCGQVGRRRRVRTRVVRDAVDALDRDTPRQVGRRAVQLLVEEVAPACDRLHDEEARGHDVRPAQERCTLVAAVQEGRDRPGDDPAVDAQAGVGRQEDLDRVVLVERVPLVDDVVGAAADQCGDGHDDDPVPEQVGVLASPPGEADQHEVDDSQAHGVADAVPADGQRPELERDRVRGEIEHPRKCSGVSGFGSRRAALRILRNGERGIQLVAADRRARGRSRTGLVRPRRLAATRRGHRGGRAGDARRCGCRASCTARAATSALRSPDGCSSCTGSTSRRHRPTIRPPRSPNPLRTMTRQARPPRRRRRGPGLARPGYRPHR